MLSLTTAQRDLLLLLLSNEAPIGAAGLGQQLHLTSRQVHYHLRDLQPWLSRRQVALRHTPGIGVQIVGTAEQRRRLYAELSSQAKFQLVLMPEQRQQLLALALLAAREPLTLYDLQQSLAVARTTVLKDLDAIAAWLEGFGLRVARRQHRGCWLEGEELAQRQALAALIWGDLPFGRPLLAVEPGQGIVFRLAQDAHLLPSVAQAGAYVREWDLAAMQPLVARAEAALGARFTDDAVLLLTLALAVQRQRVRAGQMVGQDASRLGWVQSLLVWPVAEQLAADLWPELPEAARAGEATALAVQLLCGARDEPWRGDRVLPRLIDLLMHQIADAYKVPELLGDQLLRDGLETLILPACARQYFHVWVPPRPPADTDTNTERYANERTVAARLAREISGAMGMALPPDADDDLVLLLRAAVVRARPERARHVLVVCPSGMATTQLLVARLKARFPRMGHFEVLPMRELTASRVAEADLIITTAPLVATGLPPIDVIRVHPMLKPEDVAALTQWMA